jgi:3-phenylpropionate/trans-cinnamate dioxygenase ferredoxin reductase subunit
MTNETHPIVIVGAGLSGTRVAQRLRRLGTDAPIVLIGDESGLPYDRPPLSKTLASKPDDQVSPVLLMDEIQVQELRIDLRTGVRATGLDTSRRTLSLDDGSELAYATLVVATGSRARTLDTAFPDADSFTLRNWADAVELRERLGTARHVTIVGAGVLGLEIAAGIRDRGIAVTVVEALAQPMVRVVGPEMGARLAQLHEGHGTVIRSGASLASISRGDGPTLITLADGEAWETDLVVAATGGSPNTEWLGDAVETAEGGVVCDRYGRTSDPHVFAAGDVVRLRDEGGVPEPRTEHWTSAADLAGVVAASIASSADRKPYTEVPYFWSDQHGVKIQGLGRPHEHDRLTTVMGDFDDHKALALYSRDGFVTGAVAWNLPPALMRCRSAVAGRSPLVEVLAAAPWERKPQTTP